MTEQELHNKLSELFSLPAETEVVEFNEAMIAEAMMGKIITNK